MVKSWKEAFQKLNTPDYGPGSEVQLSPNQEVKFVFLGEPQFQELGKGELSVTSNIGILGYDKAKVITLSAKETASLIPDMQNADPKSVFVLARKESGWQVAPLGATVEDKEWERLSKLPLWKLGTFSQTLEELDKIFGDILNVPITPETHWLGKWFDRVNPAYVGRLRLPAYFWRV